MKTTVSYKKGHKVKLEMDVEFAAQFQNLLLYYIATAKDPKLVIEGYKKITDIINNLYKLNKDDLNKTIENLLSIANETERWGIIKLISGGLRIGVSSRLTKIALARFSNKNLNDIEKIWHGVKPPYNNLFKWLCDKGPIPKIDLNSTFNPMMLANPINEHDFQNLNPEKFIAEWKWDGIRVQIIINKNTVKIFSRTGDDITNSFPEINIDQRQFFCGHDFIKSATILNICVLLSVIQIRLISTSTNARSVSGTSQSILIRLLHLVFMHYAFF